MRLAAYCRECGVSTTGESDDLPGELKRLAESTDQYCPQCYEPWNWGICPIDEYCRDIAPKFVALAKSGDCDHKWEKKATSENSPTICQWECSECEEKIIGTLHWGVIHELPPPVAGLMLDHKTGIWSRPDARTPMTNAQKNRIKQIKKKIRARQQSRGAE